MKEFTSVYLIETVNGHFIAIGRTEEEAMKNFRFMFPGEEITNYKAVEDRAFYLCD